MQRVVAAARNVEEVEEAAGGEDLQLLLGLVRRDPGIAHELVEGDANADGERIAHLGADRLADLEQNLAAVADGAAVAVGAVVEGGAQELAEQVAVGGMQLYPVAARRPSR